MDQATFADLLRSVVLDGLSRDLVEDWQNPPGRRRSNERTERSEWISQMSGDRRELLEAFGSEAARSALFGVLAVLDGSRAIEDGPTAGHLELRYVGAGETQILASGAADSAVLPLHELLT